MERSTFLQKNTPISTFFNKKHPHLIFCLQASTNTAYLSDITVRNIYESFTHKMAAKTCWHRGLDVYIIVTGVCSFNASMRRASRSGRDLAAYLASVDNKLS